jgi:uncharacterized protein (TIGR03437 family)
MRNRIRLSSAKAHWVFQTDPLPNLPVAVYIDGISCDVLYAGETPTVVAGLLQINARIPESASTGSKVPVYITVGGVSSQKGIAISLK